LGQGREAKARDFMHEPLVRRLLSPGYIGVGYRGAQAFFDRLSHEYGKYPNLLYESMSEPNGELDGPGTTSPTPRRP
jgi:hypothetical protein